MVWDTARKAGWLPDGVAPIHVQIGNVLGEDRKILRTRSGAPLRLMALLDEAVTTARARHRRGAPRPRRGGPRGDRPADRHRRGQVRRPLRRPRQRVRLRPRPDGRADRQHRPLPAVRGGADPLDLPERGPRPHDRGSRRRASPDRRPGAGERALALALLEFGSVVAQVGDALEPHRLCRIPLRPGPGVLDVLRALPGAQGRGRRDCASRGSRCAR